MLEEEGHYEPGAGEEFLAACPPWHWMMQSMGAKVQA